jgi:hypothetical protein
MTNYKPNTSGLKLPWKKGESGNAAGLPKGYVRASTILARLLEKKITVEEAGKNLKLTRKEAMFLTALNDAVNANNTASERTQARESVLSRIEGKPVQPIGDVVDQAIILNISPTEARL